MRNDGAVVTMSGRAATNPMISGSKSERISFRAVSTERRFDDASGEWIDGDEFGVTVVCWRQLGVSVLQLVRKGDPVVVVGKISTRKFDRDGVVDYFTEIKADHVAFDVARAIGRLKRQEGSAPAEVTSSSPVEAMPVGEHPAAEKGGDEPVGGRGGGEESGDPFQHGAEPAGQRELAAIL